MFSGFRCAGMLGLSISVAHASDFAFVSVSGTGNSAIRIIDLDTLVVVGSISNVGDEPSRMRANASRSRIYLSSWRDVAGPTNESEVILIDTASRSVMARTVVGVRTNRAVALSPDEQRVYTWKQEVTDAGSIIGVVVLDANTLADVATVPIVGTGCLTGAADVAVSPDGRIVVSGCSDGLRIIDPVTLVVTTGATAPITSTRLLGFSPDGAEVYVPKPGPIGPGGNTGVRAIDLTTGVGTDFHWDLETSSNAAFASDSTVLRMTRVQRVNDPPDNPTYFFTVFSPSSQPPVVWARASDLAPDGLGNRTRRMIGKEPAGSVSSLGVNPEGTVGLGARLGAIQRTVTDQAANDAIRITASGNPIALAGVGTLTDVIVVAGPVFADGFE